MFLLHGHKSTSTTADDDQGVTFDVDFISDHQIKFWWSKMHEIAESFCRNNEICRIILQKQNFCVA